MNKENALTALNSMMVYNNPHAKLSDIPKDVYIAIMDELRALPSISGEEKQDMWRKYIKPICPVNNYDVAAEHILKQVKIYNVKFDPVEGAIATIRLGDIRYSKRLEK